MSTTLRIRRARTFRHVGVVAIQAAATAAMAQVAEPAPARPPSAPQQLQTVTITAERREENIKNVPVSATNLSGDILDAMNAGGQDMQMLQGRTPSLNVESSYGRAFPKFYIRGYGNVDFHQNSSQPVSLVYDDVVQESSVLKGFPAFDLDRIEVLRGPQGSLFGRNTPAGVIKFQSAAPQKKFGGYVSLTEATYNTAAAEGAVNVPLGTDDAARVSVLHQHRDDWVDNVHTGQKKQYGGYNDGAARVQYLFEPSSDFRALLNVHGRTMSGSASLFRANIIKPGTSELGPNYSLRQVEFDGGNGQNLESYGSNLRLRWKLGDGLVLHSITGLEKVHVFSRGDIDGGFGAAFAPPSGPGNIPFPVESADGTSAHRQFTQEFRVESATAAPLSWQAGLYYFDEKYQVNSYSYNSLAGGVLTSLIKSHQANKAWAIFGSAKYDIDDRWNVRVGMRYTHDKKVFDTDPNNVPGGGSTVDASQGLSASPSDSKFNWDLSTVYKLTPNINAYARAATGFRGSTIQPAAEFNAQSQAKPETITSLEAGLKADLLDQTVRVGMSVYDYSVKNQQLSAVGGTSNATVLNAKETKGRGAELDLDAYLTDQLLVTLGASYNFTQIRDPNLYVVTCGGCTVRDPAGPGAGTVSINGNSLPQAPKWVANFSARYGVPYRNGEFFAFTDWSYRSRVSFVLYDSVEYSGPPLLIGGLRVGYIWDKERYELSLFGRNITNNVKLVGGIDFNNLTGWVNDFNPRIWGVQFRAKF